MSRAPSRRSRQLGTYVSVYLSQPVYDFVAEQCAEAGASLPVWIRERVIEACPPEIRAQSETLAKKVTPMPTESVDPETEALIEKHRERVRDLEARGFLPTAICAVTHLPYKVVKQILTTKAPPKRSAKK